MSRSRVSRARDDLAIGECLGPGDMVQVAVAEDHYDVPHAEPLELAADRARVLDRDMSVVDDGFVLVDERVAADAQ